MTTWVLLRGLTRESRHWGRFPETFEQIIAAADPEGVRLVPIELPGNGSANTAQSPAHVAEFVAWVRAALVARQIEPPYRVIAMSLGGMVATAWAQRAPEEIERLVLINTSMRPFCDLPQRLRPSAWPRLALAIAAWRSPSTCERMIHALTCRARDAASDDIEAWVTIRRDAPVSALNGLRQLLAAARFEAARAAPRCPTLILSSARDRLVNPVCSARIASHWGTDHLEHAWAGHDLPHDDPVWTAESVRNWLRWLDRSASADRTHEAAA